MTTVYVRARLDAMTSGQRLSIFVKGKEPRQNVASAVQSLGHHILENSTTSGREDVYCLLVLKH
ncbi:hypothetical protein GMO_16510 [Gluconobacter morbifer G707]|uniref:Uncharacterized protein n=2 Tax=Gluconobacter TaxID=441 RepID=G6XJS2_9PROT|nr:hypothetical protein GMO_16510 [Gluconobacter morbifer G707]